MSAPIYAYTPSLPRYDKGLPGFVFAHKSAGMPGFSVYGPVRVRVCRFGLSERACLRLNGSSFFLSAPELRMLAECLLDAATHIHTLNEASWPANRPLSDEGREEGV